MKRLLEGVTEHLWEFALYLKDWALPGKPKHKTTKAAAEEAVVHEVVAQNSIILTAPVEILLEVMDHLDLHDKFDLSHVCRVTRALAKREWKGAIRQLSKNEKLAFWVWLAFVMPNSWACEDCYKLHRRLDSDLPGWRVRDDEDGKPCPFGRRAPTPEMLKSNSYELRHAHVQHAIKLTQRPHDDEDGYPEKLLRPCVRLAFTPESLDMHILQDFWVNLRVVDGSCLSFSKSGFWVDAEEISLEDLDGLDVCPHMGIWEPKSAGPYPDSYLARYLGVKGFMDDVHLAFSRPGQEFSGHCSRSVTDYVAVAVDGRLVHVANVTGEPRMGGAITNT